MKELCIIILAILLAVLISDGIAKLVADGYSVADEDTYFKQHGIFNR